MTWCSMRVLMAPYSWTVKPTYSGVCYSKPCHCSARRLWQIELMHSLASASSCTSSSCLTALYL